MNLHPMIDDIELPDCLRRPLVFGDREQINALNELDVKLEKIIRRQQLIDQGILRFYEVEIEISGYAIIGVYAEDKEDAKALAVDEATIYHVDRNDISVNCRNVTLLRN